MKKVLISFGSDGYETALRSLRKSAQPYFDEIRIFGHNDLPGSFWGKYPEHGNAPRGHFLWIWKSYLILQNLATLQPDDVLMYTDALMVFIKDPSILFPLLVLEDGLLLFHQKREGHKNDKFTKKDCFVLMGCDEDKYVYGDNLNAAFLLAQNKPKAVDFVKEWFDWCENYQVVSDSPNLHGDNYPNFFAHRHDQSILSLLQISKNYNTYKDITQYGVNYPQDPDYEQIVWHHRDLECRI